MTAKVGDVLAGKYRVDKVLGAGGMGMVVAATHMELDQKVALKFMLEGAVGSIGAMDRFMREARAAVRLRSEHVCRVLDVGKLESGAPYIVMEYMEGRDFSAVIEGNAPLSVDAAVDHVLQALEGIAEAHANGIVHRDLKPGNLFVTHDHTGAPLVKVLDFGISKLALSNDGASTKTGDIMGSPSYMAPEQMMSAKHVDARADLWAIGVILYQALTGTLPFVAETLPTLCVSVMMDTPASPRSINPALPPELDAIIMRCLEKEASARYADLGELAEVLAPFGSTGAHERATRVMRALRKSGDRGRASTPTPPAGVPSVPSTRPARSGLSPAPVGVVSTLQSSAAELAAVGAPRSKRLAWIAGAVVLVGVLAVAGITVLGGKSSTTNNNAAAPPAAAPVVTAPADAASAPVVEAAPPVDAGVETPTVQPPPPAPTAEVAKPEPKRVRKPAVTTTKTTTAAPAPAPTATAAPAPAPSPTATTPAPAPKSKWTKMQHDGKTSP